MTPPANMRAITKGPGFHWFGYYDKLQFDPTGRFVLGMEVDFEHRRPADVPGGHRRRRRIVVRHTNSGV